MSGQSFPLLVLALLLGGCIEYFADSPDLGPMPPPLDGATVEACAVAPEVCDGMDNDCDGEVDEQDSPLCSDPELNAETAQWRCADGACVLRCVAGNHDLDGEYETGCEYECRPSNGSVEQCDARDNDCDGAMDEELVPPPANRQAGICEGAVRVCVGQWVEPTYGERQGYEEPEITCDGRDNDCDGLVDEDLVDCCRDGDREPPCNGCTGVAVPAGWVCIPPGEFTMGSPENEAGRFSNEGPQQRVMISMPFLLQTTEVTQAAWQAVVEHNPSSFRDGGAGACDADAPGECPVDTVNWFEAASYANLLSQAEELEVCYELIDCNANPVGEDLECADARFVGIHCAGYRLPTEAEWEYATRAGTVTRFWSGDADADLARVGWYGGNSGGRTHRVAQKPANPWGLYDVHGNVYEWVNDWPLPSYAPSVDGGALIDPVGAPTGDSRSVRSGPFNVGAVIARSARRGGAAPGNRDDRYGFRLARRAPTPGSDP